jgi:DNA-binding MarR family transcriptional regulator
LLLLRNEPQQRWDANAVARRLYIDEPRAAATLQRLVQRGLAAPHDGGRRYAAETPALGDAVQALCDIYSQRLVAITALIHGKTARGIEEFARAFVIRRKE